MAIQYQTKNIEAYQWEGDFIVDGVDTMPEWLTSFRDGGELFFSGQGELYWVNPDTFKEEMVNVGDWLVYNGYRLNVMSSYEFNAIYEAVEDEPSPEYDEIKCPKHYRGNGKITCKDAAESMMNNGVYCIQPDANDGKCLNIPQIAFGWWMMAFKYLWRWPFKGGIKDLRKCMQSIEELIEIIEKAKEEREHGQQ